MSDRSRLADALLASPIPPPNWLDPRFRGSGWRSPRGPRLRSYRFVSSEAVKAELEEVNSHLNPPVIQGWAWLLGLALIAVEVAALIGFRKGGDLVGLLVVVGPLPMWFVAVLVGASISRDVDLRDGSVFIRSWLGEWFGLPGKKIGGAASVRWSRERGLRLELEGDSARASVSLALWPSSSIRALDDRLATWVAAADPAVGRRGHHRRPGR
jgi:hypothetical protein